MASATRLGPPRPGLTSRPIATLRYPPAPWTMSAFLYRLADPARPHTMSLRTALAILFGFAAACASRPRGRSAAAACDLSPSDSAFALGRPLFRDCGVDREARFLNNGGARSDFRPTELRSTCYFADVAFVVDSTGRPEASTARIVRTNDRGFAESVLRLVALWRYEPAMLNGMRVRQIVTRHEAAATVVTVRPAGAPPPTSPPPNLPRC